MATLPDGDQGEMPDGQGSRPYRSHRYPACVICRKRKTRCIRNIDDQACRFCQRQGLNCELSSSGAKEPAPGSSRAPRRSRRSSHPQPRPRRRGAAEIISVSPKRQNFVFDDTQLDIGPQRDNTAAQHNEAGSTSENDEGLPRRSAQTHSGHIIGPVAAPDVQILEQYMSPSMGTGMPVSHARPNPYSVYSSDWRNPIVYLKVPRQRVRSSKGNGSAGFQQYEAVEKVLEPLGSDVVDLFFQVFHPAFPILDEKTVLESYRKKELPHVLVCEIYACAMISWPVSTKLATTRPHRPDVRYIWNKTVEALNGEFLAAGFSTVLSCILDLTGRPTTSMTYNANNIGRAVALSQSLGLNRDPSAWNLDPRQKALRIRTWWGVLIHDWWASLAHGTPPHVNPRQFDVGVPDLAALLIGGVAVKGESSRISSPRAIGAQSFRALCQLTEILGNILPFIYDIKRNNVEVQARSLKRIEASLEDWEDNLPRSLNMKSLEFRRDQPGALNLYLSFLAIKMCICRVLLLESVKSDDASNSETFRYVQLQCRRAAQGIVDFTLSLRGNDLHAFWMPYTAYHFTSAAILLLRCGLEAANADTAKECISGAQSLVDHLRKAKADAQWDLGDTCLSQCDRMIQQLSDRGYLSGRHQRQPRDERTPATAGQRFEPSRTSEAGQSHAMDIDRQTSAAAVMAAQAPPSSNEPVDSTVALDGLGGAFQEGVGMWDSWDPFAQLTIPDLWDATELNDYNGSIT